MKLVAVAGTGTEVGKTFVAAGLLRALDTLGCAFTPRKPVQSYAPGDDATDADVLARAAGVDPTDVCPAHRWLATPLAPPMAAEALGLPPFTIADLASELTTGLPPDAHVLVETVGGVRSPIAEDGDCADLIAALAPVLVVLVADAGLGTINAVRLSVDGLGAHPTVVFLNRFDRDCDLHARNLAWLTARAGLHVLTGIVELGAFVARAVDRTA
jgi:dethiobiotin synthase